MPFACGHPLDKKAPLSRCLQETLDSYLRKNYPVAMRKKIHLPIIPSCLPRPIQS